MEHKASNIFSHLITDEAFRDWVIHPDEQKNRYWKQWMSQHPESVSEVKKAREFIERMHDKKEQLSSQEEDALFSKIMAGEPSAFRSKTRVPRTEVPGMDIPRTEVSGTGVPRKSVYHISQWGRVAAIILICFMVAFVADRILSVGQVEPAPVAMEWKTVDNPKGVQSKVTLPDGTIVILNAASELKYPKFFSDTQRLVALKGEAFFDVVRDESKPFIIQTERMTTEVLGTSFNIKAYAGGPEEQVAVVSGKVKVSNTAGSTTILTPNEMGSVSDEAHISKSSFDVQQITGWKDGIITFKRASFQDIEMQLSAWYGVDFIVENGFRMENVYSGEFVNETLENVMNGIAYSSGFKYKIAANKVYIYQ